MEESFSLLSDFDIHLFREGKHYTLYQKLGSHLISYKGESGVFFAVWAPDSAEVSVIGNFNFWNKGDHKMSARWDSSGIWEIFIPGIGNGEAYKFAIKTKKGDWLEKSDPFARYAEEAPNTASIVWDTEYKWKDNKWLKKRREKAGKPQPVSVYEVHLGSWKRKVEGGDRPLTYGELAVELVDYLKETEFTHVEFLPVMEHPFYGSWGYQLLGLFAPTSRYGSPQDFMFLVDRLHDAGIGVILDWVPSHFPGDAHGLYLFDGTHLFEHADPKQGYHPDWTSYIFNYGRNEIRSFLISSAMCWMDLYHADGIRVDAVASMLYLDYSRKDGEWIPNKFGGNENLEAIQFLQELNIALYGEFPDVLTIAEESTSWSKVSSPVYAGGLGFGQKWMMGWMHDTLEYFKNEPVFRKYHQDTITFGLVYAFTENFMLPLSHDEVVHGKGSLLGRMPGDEWQRFANLRMLFGFMYGHPGSKLLFMGSEFGQYEEWNHEKSLDWHLLDFNFHRGMKDWVTDLNKIYKSEPAFYVNQFEQKGFEWIDYSDYENSVIAFLRCSDYWEETVLVACNFTPVTRNAYRLGVPHSGIWEEILNSDNLKYSGSGVYNGEIQSQDAPCHGRNYSLELNLPPLGVTFFRLKQDKKAVDRKTSRNK